MGEVPLCRKRVVHDNHVPQVKLMKLLLNCQLPEFFDRFVDCK